MLGLEQENINEASLSQGLAESFFESSDFAYM